MQSARYIKNQYIEMWIEDGVFFGKYSGNIVIDYACALKVMEDRETLCENTSYVTVWDCRGVSYWTRDARIFQNSERNYRLMKAGAVIYSNSHVATVIINSFLYFNKPPIPARFFTSMERAFQWIQKYK